MIYYYGGSFDPITVAHIDILKTISKQMGEDDVLMIGVTNNDEKVRCAPISARIEMVQKIVKDKVKCVVPPRILQQEMRTYKYLQTYQQQVGKTDITICVGEDEWASICAGKWVNWDLLLNQYEFLVIYRPGTDAVVLPKNFKTNVKFVSAGEKCEGVSSSAVRDILSRDPNCHFDEVNQFVTHQTFRYIKENELYWQNGPDYDKKEKEFIAHYNGLKAENGWSEPSVTTDTIAFNGNEVLLIRRGNYPFKNFWCLPGGFFEPSDEDLNYGAARELREETGLDLDPEKFEQIRTYGHNFDPRLKVVDVAYSIRVPKGEMHKAIGSDDAAEARWFGLDNLPKLGFHHAQIINDWLKTRED